ncbi:MAG: Ppx/GppA family phosphatase [Bdellovibrionales bacterium]|nr:Ppx/GppA family phosphatase [Bdellovibrionales bacterium]
MRVAAIDLGSNSFLQLIADVEEGKIIQVISDEVEITRLAQDVNQNKKLHPEALQRAEKCFQVFHSVAQKFHVDKSIAVATSAARDSSNSEELIELGKKYGIKIYVIDGPTEAQLSFSGATYDEPYKKEMMIVDVGGGSTEFLSKSQQDSVSAVSIDVGCVRLYELFWKEDPISSSHLIEMKHYIRKSLQSYFPSPESVFKMLAVAGTPTTLACLEIGEEFNEQKIEGMEITKMEIELWEQKLCQHDVLARKSLPGMPAKRADVIGVGAVILNEAMDHFSTKKLVVTTKGVRHGLAMEHLQF